ncbi:Uma2 family endonuclease [Synechococcus sp. Nb3U1]|uniref:Uma2 family endonuclease n=1 Tax=Synechococcus sp. Nb3U1 TaxID=1914529 RepID=UPI001F46882F|nr:Uma2 family endonuclease [Synechococcus sp. Nb3U1]MCF2970006.1 Uma2 family endonuclease [Synechococcus sp. Nb3U1]
MLTSSPLTLRIPPLENGDRLTRTEFEQRYEAMPELKKAELIEGVVYIMGSPLRIMSHGQPHGQIMTWLGTYNAYTPGLILGDTPTVRLDPDNEPQPDVVLFLPGRGAIVSEDDYIEGSPDLIVEIAASSASIDLHDKKRAYRRNGIQDYIVWRTLEQQLDWFCLKADDYQVQIPDEQGILRSQAFPGLWLDPVALLTGDMPKVLSVLQQGLGSAEHQTFIQQISSSGEPT